MKKQVLCKCGSGVFKDDCCIENVRVRSFPGVNASERMELLAKIKISSEFGMRYRGLFEFYGDDLIKYKLGAPNSLARNEFLTVLAKYFTDYLEDDCPTSWKECHSQFWEEFLFIFYPFHMKITREEREVEKFSNELKKFLRWLDRRYRSSFYKLIEKYLQESGNDLKKCEQMLNRLYLHLFPRMHHKDWNPEKAIYKNSLQLEECIETKTILFEVKRINGPIVIATSLDSHITYHLKGMPYKSITSGLIMCGMIGRKKGDWFWIWNFPETVFPQRAKQFFDYVRF
ncbi:hypothetical protein H1D32_09855 [Anaerobacillus sp. CMMVII]|uniref:hypothetical protein n=1 Tax=Anaerobacillus sp. CMMVII TaxID=2755588 RepID=UPI0021B75D01|nr:hypothetical protein [Anaerobacillus sp. CMMVII]MCT8138034.1 hypothetical protein [Anaerobacillus sp. CMMVII]